MTVSDPTKAVVMNGTSSSMGVLERETPPGRQNIKLTIVIPALNEEDAIGGTIQRCLDAREKIMAQTGVTEVGIVVVSDGSTDRTPEIARGFKDVQVIVFEKNRGYGAAIKEGWRQGGGDLLAFLDADGTCDPEYFIPMCRAALDDKVDVVLGNRMGADSQMPKVRRIGNFIFAILLGLLSKKSVQDTASGMRVIRKDALPRLLPLPNGLQFTPAMSARVLMDEGLAIREVPMAYAERIGRSKLRVIKDGFRFLRVILSAAVYLRPSRVTLPIAALLGLFCLLYSISPIRHYLAYRSLPEDIIYRFLAILTAGMMVNILLSTTLVAEHMIALSRLRYSEFLDRRGLLWGRGALRAALVLSGCSVLAALVLIWPGVWSYLTTRQIPPGTMHWSRLVVASFFVLTFWQMLATASMLQILSAMNDRQRFLVDRS